MAAHRVLHRSLWTLTALLISVIAVFAGIRINQDVPAILKDTLPPAASFERRYAEHPLLAYAHILPGLLYLGIAPFQVSERVRNGDIPRHRRLGRIALVAGLITGAFAIVVGLVFPYGGVVEASASTIFGLYFLSALALAYRAVRRGDVDIHRRWMIRAFAIGIGVGTIRLVIGFSQAFGVAFDSIFGLAFWIAFVTHAIAAEWWLQRFPTPP